MSESAPAGTAGNIAEEKVFAALSWWFILGPIFLFAMKDKPFVRHHAAQGTVLFACSLVIAVFSCVAQILFSDIAFVGLLVTLATRGLGLLPFLAAIIGTIKAVNGERWECPILGGWAKKIPV